MSKDQNPFANARTPEEREKVWKSLKAKRVSRKEAERLMAEAIRLQKAEIIKKKTVFVDPDGIEHEFKEAN